MMWRMLGSEVSISSASTMITGVWMGKNTALDVIGTMALMQISGWMNGAGGVGMFQLMSGKMEVLLSVQK